MSMALDFGQVPQWTVADRLRKARENAGLGQAELAERARISRGTISAAENGLRMPTRASILAWAMATGVPVVWIEHGIVPSGSTPEERASD